MLHEFPEFGYEFLLKTPSVFFFFEDSFCLGKLFLDENYVFDFVFVDVDGICCVIDPSLNLFLDLNYVK